jgi:hypothetical protein
MWVPLLFRPLYATARDSGTPCISKEAYRMFKARHEMIALAALLLVAVVALVVFEVAHLGHLHF